MEEVTISSGIGFVGVKYIGDEQSTIYSIGGWKLKPLNSDKVSLINSSGDIAFENRYFSDIINGETGEPFDSYSALETYVKQYFFPKPSGGAGGGWDDSAFWNE